MAKDDELFRKIWNEYEKGVKFNNAINLNDTVETNENFFVGKQWEGVESNGLPTPVFNFLKRVTLFQVASVTSDNIKMQASPLAAAANDEQLEQLTDIVNNEFDSLFEHNKIPTILREFMRNAAVDSDGCTYTYWDPDIETGQSAKGAIVTEILENTRVFFGNPNDRRVQKQPHIIIARREMLEDVRERAKKYAGDSGDIKPDSDDNNSQMDGHTDDKVTVLLKLWKDRKTGSINGCECTRNAMVRDTWDLGLSLYPITWLNWDYIQDCYHGQALITGLIPNQIFVNKLFAMSMISLMTTAYPKIIYDRTRIPKWTNQVGSVIGVNGVVEGAAKIIDPAAISPQISQFIELAVDYTQNFLGATSAAMGDTRPDNTSAIIALQRASSIPSEITKQNLYQSIEDLGRIYLDFMAEYYGQRLVDIEVPQNLIQFSGMSPGSKMQVPFDFSLLKDTPMSLKLDVGASAYWSEIASMQTLDNLIMQGKIDIVDYLERVPDGYISKKGELIAKLKAQQGMMAQMQGAAPGGSGELVDSGAPTPIPIGGGNSALQRKVNETGVTK